MEPMAGARVLLCGALWVKMRASSSSIPLEPLKHSCEFNFKSSFCPQNKKERGRKHFNPKHQRHLLLGAKGGVGSSLSLVSPLIQSPRRKPWPQVWRPPLPPPPPPPPPPCSWAAGLVGGTPKPDTPPLLLGKNRYKNSGVERKVRPPRSMGYLNMRKK